jgi:hypothetical protein
MVFSVSFSGAHDELVSETVAHADHNAHCFTKYQYDMLSILAKSFLAD